MEYSHCCVQESFVVTGDNNPKPVQKSSSEPQKTDCTLVCYLFELSEQNINMEDQKTLIEQWIRNRKSTFVNGLKEGGDIPDGVISNLLENAIWAPSHGLVQAWSFKVFAGMGVNAFFGIQQKIYKETTPPEKFREEKFEKYLSKSSRVSHVLAVIMQRDVKKRFPKQEDLVSVACAVQNIYLSMQAYGIAGYLSTGDICYTQQMREFLRLGEEDECLGFFILGLPDENVSRPARKRIPASEKTQWIRE